MTCDSVDDRGPTLPANAPELDLLGNMDAARDLRRDDTPLAQVLETCARKRQGEDGILEAGVASLSIMMTIKVVGCHGHMSAWFQGTSDRNDPDDKR